MKTSTTSSIALSLLIATMPTLAHAYVGPGAGLSLAAAFWAVLVAIGTIVGFTLLWPIRRMMRKRATATARTATGTRTDEAMERERGSAARS